MNILIIHQFYLRKGEAGISRFNQFAKYWSQNNHKITVITGTSHHMTGEVGREVYKGKIFIKEKIGENIKVIRTYVSPNYNKNFFTRLTAYFTFLISSTFSSLYSGKQDVVIATSPPLFVGITGYITSRLKRIPFIFEVRDLWPDFAILAGVLKNRFIIKLSYFLESFIYKKADLINVLTPAFAQVLKKKKKVPERKIVYVPNGADLDLMSPGSKNNWVRNKYNWQNKFIVLYVGAHGLANYLDLILDTAKIMRDYKDIIFVLIGDGMLKPKLMVRAKTENLKNVFFLDPVPKEKIADFINASDACTAILKKIYNTTYPNKVFDYMSCAKPIVLPIDGAARELVIDKAKAGIYVEPENSQEFKKAILKLYHDANLRDSYGMNGYHFVKENFPRQKLAKKYEEIIRGIVDKNK
ncbi:glycosyltransferase family 4 protein [Patescibacteria group bacterium]|nr:glycosyltransferase family 4 protein [Patescibacteria group bacterium]